MIKDQALYDKLVAKVRVDEKTGCWLWTGSFWGKRKWPQNRYGYISLWLTDKKKTRTYGTHRAMMIAIHGPLTPQQCACHRCDVPLCINPQHLFIGSMKDNIRDSRSKNRHHEAQKEFCVHGHPLSGENLYLSTQARSRGIMIRRACRTCQKARYRIKLGWPEHLAYDMNFRVPHGYRLDRTTFQIVPSRGRISPDGRSNGPSGNELGRAVNQSLWPTPTVKGNYNKAGLSAKSGDGLATAIRRWPTPNARDHKDTGSNVNYDSERMRSKLPGAVGGSLNPTWVEWLMGFPLGWTVCEAWEMRSSRRSRKSLVGP